MQAHSWKRLARGTAGFALTASLAAMAMPRTAHCEPKKPAAAAKSDNTLEILGIVSDDVEEQADALSEALRFQARQLPGVTVGKATQTLDVMTTANKCPQSPDPSCQQDIAKQLKTSQYIWGILKKAPDNKVTIELHHYVKDKPDHILEISYASNLRDQNDDALRKIARRLLVELLDLKTGFVHVTGIGPMATCNVKMDGQPIGALRDGTLLSETTPGAHTITTEGCPSFTGTATVTASREVVVTLTEPGAKLPPGVSPPAEDKKPFFTGRKIAAVSMAGVGLAAGVVGIVFATKWSSAKSSGNDAIALLGNPNNLEKPSDYCGVAGTPSNSGADVCRYDKDARTASTVAWIAGGAGAALVIGGVVLWVTDPKQETGSKSANLTPKVRLQPSVGVTNGLWLSGTF